jgi:CarboxypepD_reg-like domain
MTNKDKNTKLKAEDIKKYLSGNATPTEKHEAEKKLLNDAFATDAADGFEALKKDKIDEKAAINDLKKRLDSRIKSGSQKKLSTKTIPLWQNISVAASVVLVLGASLYFFVKTTDNQTVTSKESAIPNQDLSPKSAPIENKQKEIIENQSIEKSKKTERIAVNKSIETEAVTLPQAESQSVNITTEIEEKTASIPPPPKAEEVYRSVAKPSAAMAKTEVQQQFSGQILDKENNPIAGVSISLKSAVKGTQTDINGNFRINDLKVGDVLQISSIGYSSQELVVKSTDLGKIKLSEDAGALSEVVVVGYGKAKEAQTPTANKLNQEPMPKIGWTEYDNYLLNTLKNTSTITKSQLKEPLRFSMTVEPNGDVSNVQIENNLPKEQTQKVVEAIEKGPKWLPATKKGKKVRKNILRELFLK